MTASNDLVAARLLEAAIHSLRSDVLPFIDDDVGHMRVDHITRLLRAASARISIRESSLQRFVADTEGISGLSSNEGLSLEEQYQRLESELANQIPDLLDGAAQGNNSAVTTLEHIIAAEKRLFVAQDPDILKGSQVVYRGGRIDAESETELAPPWPPLDDERLTRYLQQRFGRDSVRVEKTKLIPGGFSKETVFFNLVDHKSGTEERLVIRKDMPLPFIDQSVNDEFATLQALYHRGFPVAKPLWLESDASRFGGSFIVSERVAGTSNAATWTSDPQAAAEACKELARILAQLHSYDPTELGYSQERSQLSCGQLMEGEIARWTKLFYDRRQEPLLLQELPLLWLARNIPAALYQRKAVVLHGDFGFHNLMFDEHGKVTALLDWEFSVLGDPTQDLCFVKMFVEPLMDWQAFLELYRGFGGVEECGEAMFFFDLWIKARNSIGCVAAKRLFNNDLPNETKFALAGHCFAPYLYIEQCESILNTMKN